MINMNRIVPITSTDLITMYGTIMKLAGTNVTAVSAVNPGHFELTEGSGNLLANEPVTTLDFGSGVTSVVVYFVPAYDYTGFTIGGETVTPEEASVEVNPDGRTLYTATLSSGGVTIAQAGF